MRSQQRGGDPLDDGVVNLESFIVAMSRSTPPSGLGNARGMGFCALQGRLRGMHPAKAHDGVSRS